MRPVPSHHLRVTTYHFRCLQCGRLAQNAYGEALLVGVITGHRVATIAPRCETCSGRCFPEEQDTYAYRTERSARVTEETPRKGRPPRWLQEQRRRQAVEDAETLLRMDA